MPTHVSVAPGTPVALTIELQPGKGLQVMAEVAWHRSASGDQPAGVGLRFTHMRPEHRQWLEQSVGRYSQQQLPSAGPAARPHLRAPIGGVSLTGASLHVNELTLGEGGPVLGIDLGTSNSCASVWQNGEVKLLTLGESAEHPHTIPSVVAYKADGSTVVGQQALELMHRNAPRTVFGSKRFIGRSYDHPDVQAMLVRYPYKVVPGAGRRAAVDINGRPISLVSVSARVLSAIRSRAEAALSMPVDRAIITVPAFYNQNQRDAVVQAGRLAGLTVEHIVSEPTAAAIAYGVLEQNARTLLVYDLGGGTFDVSVMRVAPPRLQVLATAGDTFLGGEDFDALIVDWVCDQFRTQTHQQLSRNHQALVEVKRAAEKAKCRLTMHEATRIMVREALLQDGSRQRVEMELTRATVEKLVEPLVSRTLRICDMALEEANVTAQAIDDVILVGGQTLMPYVQRRVAQHFGRQPLYRLRADEVVGMGAGMLAGLRESTQGVELSDVLSMSIGLGLGGGRFHKLLLRNTPVPTRVRHVVQIPKDRLRGYALQFYQGEAPEVQRNEHLGTLRLGELSLGKADPVPVELELILSPDCLLKVRATNVENGSTVDMLLDTRDSLG